MIRSKSEKRLAQNQLISKETNQKIYEGLEKLEKASNKDDVSGYKKRVECPVAIFCASARTKNAASESS